MTPAGWIAFGAFALFAALDWAAAARGLRRLEIVAKPLATGALIALAVAIDPTNPAQRVWFVIALVFSLGGDVALLDDRRFVIGLAAFLLAHLCYIIGLWLDPHAAGAVLIATLLTAIAIAPIAARVVSAIRSSLQPEFAVPVIAYVTVISAMLISALSSGSRVAAVGAVLFAASDSMIAWNRFVRPFPAAGAMIMVTYHLGQLGLVLSLIH